MTNAAIDVTLLITFHRERILAHSTLNSIERSRRYAHAAGIRTEYVWVLDAIDDETRKVLNAHPCVSQQVRIVEVAHRDAGASRNAGIAAARGKVVAILDGDDYYSENWIERGYYYLSLFGGRCIVHPEIVVSFGEQKVYARMIDQGENIFDKHALLVENLWTLWTIAPREIYQAIPYVTTRAKHTGFGHEDWHWNCETIGAGIEHRLAPGTVAFYRRKRTGVLAESSAVNALMPPSRLFAKGTSERIDDLIGRLLFQVAQSGHQLINQTLVRMLGTGSGLRQEYLARAEWLKGRLRPTAPQTVGLVRGCDSRPLVDNSVSTIPDWVLEEMRNVGRGIDPALYPNDAFLYHCQHYEFPIRPAAGRIYEAALVQCRSSWYTHCFTIPWLKRGGADLVTLFHIQVVAGRPRARVLVIMTEPGDSPWLHRMPAGVDVICLAAPLATLSYADGLLVLARLLVQLRIDVLHIINSRHTWDVIGKYGLAIRQNSRIFGSIYCDDYDRSGVPTGFARDYLGACYQHLTKLFSDNTAFPRLLQETYGYSPDMFQVLKSPAAFNLPAQPVRAPEGKRVLWAGRLDRQKRPDILLAVAREMPDVEFVVYGEVLMDSDQWVIQELAGLKNLRMMGPFDGVEALPFGAFPVYLYTSQWDGTPTIVIGAALASIPIVASCVGGVGDIITEQTGFPVKDMEDIAVYVRSIAEALEAPTVAETRAAAARELVQTEYTLARFEAGLIGCEGYLDGLTHIARHLIYRPPLSLERAS